MYSFQTQKVNNLSYYAKIRSKHYRFKYYKLGVMKTFQHFDISCLFHIDASKRGCSSFASLRSSENKNHEVRDRPELLAFKNLHLIMNLCLISVMDHTYSYFS